MTKRFSPQFKLQVIEHVLSNSHTLLNAIAERLGVSYLTLDGLASQFQWLK